ncbi:uncharacterized protein TRAVEDRAFT_68599 [Trametes versicolor FP-101664 SS1]|uniref:uncharacterized protein n=1 Tax=Trametes versicolor (strain FP-101664) TaxID=717944 RepID=UPI0004623285|nr:uncharacterized protein TRAVEDRAFT_68599 [Trametes versicolor FP-101664 SS1]EIW64899.1 hypothetical protein TRAVEDRAFT_68599 [Trametes versicolor FP-101664 SS1]
MPKRDRDEAVAELSSTIFSAMLEEILMDVVQQSHKEVARARAVCDVCHTRCNSVHVPGPSNGGNSRVPTPNGETNSPAGTGANTPVNGTSKDGNVYLACLECKREISSNRYATHLSSCMGIGNRRGAARGATAKSKMGSEMGKSASPRLASEVAHLSDDGGGGRAPPTKGKGKAKGKKTDDSALNSNGKRNGSPSISPAKKSKKQKTGAAGRIKSELDSPGSPSNLLPVPSSTARIPSRLRESSIASSFQRDRRSSSPESPTRSSPARSISTQASTVIRSPAISSANIKSKQTNGKGRGAGAPPRLPSPPRPPPPVPIIRMPDTDYLVDVEGEETGSSTDTDSD